MKGLADKKKKQYRMKVVDEEVERYGAVAKVMKDWGMSRIGEMAEV